MQVTAGLPGWVNPFFYKLPCMTYSIFGRIKLNGYIYLVVHCPSITIVDEITFDKDGSFTVADSRFINYLGGFVFLALFLGVLVTRDFEIGQQTGDFYFIYFTLVIPCLLFFVKGTRKRISIIVNTTGVYYQATLVTTWGNFINAFIRQEEYSVNNYSAGISDRFKIVVEYYDARRGGNFLYAIPTSS